MATTYDAVILAAGDYPTHPIALQVLQQAPYLVCCDGAAQTLLDHGIIPHAIVGDGDSLPIAIKQQYPQLVHTESEQEYNDLTKATRYTLLSLGNTPNGSPHRGGDVRRTEGVFSVAYLGCTGLREDHTLGNISLIAYYQREFHIQPVMYTDHGYFTPALGTHTFPTFPGQQISIFRIGGNTLRSEELRWNAYPYNEWWQGTLNEALSDHFTIHSDGQYIIFQTYEGKSTPQPTTS